MEMRNMNYTEDLSVSNINDFTNPAQALLLASGLFNTFITRTDNYAVQNMDGSYNPQNCSLTFVDLQNHVAGDTTIGIYPIDKENKVKFLALDIDVNKEHTDKVQEYLPALQNTARKLLKAVEDLSLYALLEFSGRKGYHVILLFAEPVPAVQARQLGRVLISKIGTLPNGLHIEIFPKQDSVDGKKGLGNLIKLPFALHKVSGQRSVLLNPIDFHPVADPVRTLGEAPRNTHQSIERAVGSFKPDVTKKLAASTGIQLNQPGLDRMIEHCPIIKMFEANPCGWDYDPWLGIASNYIVFDGGWERFTELCKRESSRFSQDKLDDLFYDISANWNGPQSYVTFEEQGVKFELPVGAPKAPAGWARYVDTDKLLGALKAVTGTARFAKLKEHFASDFLDFAFDRQLGWISKLAQELQIDSRTLSRMALEALLCSDLKDRVLKDILRNADGLYGSPEDAGKLIFKWFTQNGGLVYRDREHKGYWIWEGSVYEIGNNQSFFTFMWKVAGLTHEGMESRKIWAVLKAETDVNGVLLNSFTWIHSELNHNTVYLHLNLENEKILRISSDGVEQVENGANEDHVLLAPSAKMVPITLESLNQAGYQDALQDFDKLVLRNMGCSRDNQLMYGAWCLAYPLIDYVMTKPNMRCDGSSESGKTRGTNLISYFVYGADHLKNSTEAANYTDGASNPLVLLDNVEKDNFRQGLGDFLLMAATGITKEKRQMNTDRGTVQERVHCLVATTGVENLGKTEHINRTLSITFDRWKYKSPGWSERVFGRIAAERHRLVSAHMTLISKVLGRIAKGELEDWLDFLEQNHPGHAKNRANSFIGLMGLILTELLPAIQTGDTPEKVISRLIKEQSSSGRTVVSESNPIIMFLEAVLEDAGGSDSTLSEDFQHWGYEVTVRDNKITGTAAQLHRTFSAVAKRKGMKYEYKDPKQLAVRIADTAQTLKIEVNDNVIKTKEFLLSTSPDRTKTKKYTFDFNVERDEDSEDKDLQVD